MFDNSATAEALFGTQSLRIDEKWLFDLEQIVYFFVKGQPVDPDGVELDTVLSMINVFEKFREDKMISERL